MRICLIASVPIPPEEGIGQHVWNLALQLRTAGHEVGIITRGGIGPTDWERLQGIDIWRVTFWPIYPLHVHLHSLFVNKLLRTIDGAYDLFNLHTPLPAMVQTNRPIVTTVHSPMKADTSATQGFNLRVLALRLQTPMSVFIEKRLFDHSQRITAVAGWIPAELQTYGVKPKDVQVTGNGVESRFYETAELEQALDYALYVGRIEIGKGLEDLVEAAQIMLKEHADLGIQFVVVGKGPRLAHIQKLVRKRGLKPWFRFEGHLGANRRAELIDLYQKALFFVLPSHHEGMPTVLLEAMASARPVVATAVGGAKEVVIHGKNGLLVPIRSPRKLADAMLNLVGSHDVRKQLGQHARSTIIDRFSWQAVAARYIECYRSVLES